MDIGHLIEENISNLEKIHKGVLWTTMERRGSGVEVQLRGDLEEVGLGLELGNCPWEEVDVPHTEEGVTPLISACQKGMIEGELLSGMFRPLPHRAELLQAAWQGDLHSLQHLLAQTDLLDVNTQNQEGLTPLMLAVRDVDLFEGLGVRLPWEYRPVEVVRELLALAADLRVRDHRGCSALHYAAHINSPLKEELIQMMVESLRQPVPTPLDLQCFHPPEEELRTNNCPSPSVLTHSFLIQTAACTEEVLESSECVPLSEHHKAVGQDKGISLCFQSAMDTLRGMRQAYQDVGKGSSRGSSLPRLWDRGRHWDKLSTLDPPPGPLKTTGTSCLPVPPRPRGRCESVAHSPANLAVPQPSLLSQSAPTLMEPLLDSSSLLQARAHIQNRLGCGETEKNNSGRKGSLPALRPGPIRTPKLLAPLEGRPRDQGLLPGLKWPPSLKPISLLPLCSMSRMRRERLTRGSPRGPLTTRGGSEESSSSSQSSIDLEEEEEVEDHDDNHIHSENSEKQHGEAYDERLHMDLDSSAKFHVADYSEARADLKIRDSMINQLSIAKDINNGEQPIKSHSEGRRCFVALTREGVSETKHRLTFDFTDNKDVDSPSCYERNSGDELGALGEFSKEEPHIDLSLATCSPVSKSHGDKEIQVDHRNVKFGGVDTKYQCLPHMVNITLSDLNKDKIKPIKPVRNKDRRGSFQTNQSFNALAHKDHIGGNVKYKGNQRTSSIPSQVKAKVRKSPDLVISSEVTVRSKLNSAKIIQKNTDMTSVRKRVTEPLRPTTKRSNTDKKTLNNTKAPNQKQLPQREPKSARQPKKSGALSTPRAKSAVDYITYNDMFQEINSGDDEGPAIYEMFAGPVYDNLRVSSSCERSRQVQSAPPRKTHQAHRIKHKCPKPLEGSNRQRRSPVDKLVSTKGKQRKSRAIITRGKPRPTPATMDEREDEEDDDDVVVMSRLDWHIQASKTNLVLNDDDNDDDDDDRETIAPKTHELEVGDHTLSVIEEVLSSHASETLIPHYRSGDKTIPNLTETKHIPHPDTADRFCEQEKVGSMGNMYDTGNNYCKSNRLDPEYTSSGSPVQPKINTWTSDSCDRTMSPVFQKFLDEVGEGPLTEDLLRCLAEELISLDERDERDEMVRDASLDPENCDSHKREFTHDSATRHDKLQKDITSPGRVLSGSELVVDDAISWTKGEVLGRGAYGTVYCGLTSQGQLIAVKQVVLDASDPDTADKEYNRLQDEVDLLKNLRHSNIVGFLDTSLRHNVVSIFMEYVPGGSISSVLHRFGPLPERVLALYTQQILEGVAYLHLNRVIHRDLKGNNIMLMPTGVVKLIDFGCARRLSRLTHTSSRSELLKSVHGTPYWMAPEVINETGHGRKSDIWSIGCTVFEMATGKPPLSHMDKMAALFYIGARRGLMPSLPEGFSEDARDFVQVCLTSDQKQRPSAEQLLEHRFIPKTEVGQSLI